MQNNITIPKFFHELFGTEQTVIELLLVLIFTVGSIFTVGFLTHSEWSSLSLIRQIVLWFLYLDISGGIVANLTHGTNSHYAKSSKARWVFIAIHIQPLLLLIAYPERWTAAITIWAFTILSASLVNLLRKYDFQRTLAGFLVGVLSILFFTYSPFIALPNILKIIYSFYGFKVIYSFAVDHERIYK